MTQADHGSLLDLMVILAMLALLIVLTLSMIANLIGDAARWFARRRRFTVNVGARTVTRGLTIKVTGLRSLAFRLKVAALVLRFGAWVAGVGIEIDGPAAKADGSDLGEINGRLA